MNYWIIPLIKFRENVKLPTASSEYDAETIIHIVSKYFELDSEEIFKKDRHERIRQPRQICMYLLEKYTRWGPSSIGRRFRRDHTTVIHAIARVKDLLDTEDVFINDIRKITHLLQAQNIDTGITFYKR